MSSLPIIIANLAARNNYCSAPGYLGGGFDVGDTGGDDASSSAKYSIRN